MIAVSGSSTQARICKVLGLSSEELNIATHKERKLWLKFLDLLTYPIWGVVNL